jgi:hypothetical protein
MFYIMNRTPRIILKNSTFLGNVINGFSCSVKFNEVFHLRLNSNIEKHILLPDIMKLHWFTAWLAVMATILQIVIKLIESISNEFLKYLFTNRYPSKVL